MSAMDRAHEVAAALTAESSEAEILAALDAYREAWHPGGQVLTPGTFAWFMVDLLPSWLRARL